MGKQITLYYKMFTRKVQVPNPDRRGREAILAVHADGKPLAKERWAAVVDSVGSHTLANACAQTKNDGAVTACGLAQGMDFPSSVAPFILRAVTLYGINSVTVPRAKRIAAYEQLSQLLDLKTLDEISHEITLEESLKYAQELMAGNVRGRLVVDVNK
jgi:acrylyl-CoA reductase (NADPH)